MDIHEEIENKESLDFMCIQMNFIKVPFKELNETSVEGFQILLQVIKNMVENGADALKISTVQYLDYLLHYAQEFEEYELCGHLTKEIKSREEQ